MATVRVHQIAKEFGVDSRTVIAELKRQGVLVKSASSTVTKTDLERVRAVFHGWDAPRPNPRGVPASAVARRLAPPPERAQQPAVKTTSMAKAASHDAGGPSQPSIRPSLNLHGLSGVRDVNTVLIACREALGRGGSRLTIDMGDAEGFYPSAAAPFAAIVQHFRSAGLQIDLRNVPEVAEVMSIRNPQEASEVNLMETEPLSRMWVYFDHQQANRLTSSYMDCIRRKVECKTGVLEALEWCLYEILDNVMQHSKSDLGFAMLQIHIRSKRLAVCVADTGIGVQRSLASSSLYKPRTAFDALTLAVKEGVTRDKRTNQGNGLFGLSRIVEQNGGKLWMRSGRGFMLLEGDRWNGRNNQPVIDAEHHGTVVDFQLKIDKPVSLGDALNYTPTNHFLEGLESDDGEHVIQIRQQAGGAGSRLAARELKRLVVNVLNEGVPHVVLDFEGQTVVSSSFADEVIGKMVADMGFTGFSSRIQLRNMNPTVVTLVDRAIARRLGQK